MKSEDIRSLSADELRTRVAELRDEQFRLRFRGATETLESPLRLRAVRRDIARALTVLGEQERGAAAKQSATKSASKKTAARKSAAKKSATKTAASKTATKKTATTKTASKRAAKSAATKTAR